MLAVADPTVKQRLEEIREAAEKYRAAGRSSFWLGPIALVLAAAIYPFYGFLPAALIVAVPALGIPLFMLRVASMIEDVKIACPACSFGVPVMSKWVCGFCSKTRDPKALFNSQTFAERCRPPCKQLSHSIICRKCRKPIIFDEAAFKNSPTNVSYVDGHPPPPPVPETPAVAAYRPPRTLSEHLR